MSKQDLISLKEMYLNDKRNNSHNELDMNSLFAGIYPFTTENISGYLELMNIENKDFLTVCGSGDQYLNLILHGANKVDVFDINPLTIMYLKLKVGAIKALSKEEFLLYFLGYDCINQSVNTSFMFNINLYYKIAYYLDNETRQFWDNLYLENRAEEIINSCLFTSKNLNYDMLLNLNDYLKDNNYQILKNKLKHISNIDFININVRALNNKLNDKYDYILLSNISDYLDSMFYKEELKSFRNILLQLSDHLKENGQIMSSYLYDCFDDYRYERHSNEIYKKSKRDEVFKDELEFYNIESVYNMKWHCQAYVMDGVLMYKKKTR